MSTDRIAAVTEGTSWPNGFAPSPAAARTAEGGRNLGRSEVSAQVLSERARLANRLQRLVEALPGGVVVLDGDGRVEQCNRAAVEIFGRSLEGRLWREVATEVFAPKADDVCDISLFNGRRVNVTTRSLGVEPGQILLINDVTETRELQAKLSEVQRLSEMGKMMAALAHQIRTPIASALLHLSNLQSIGDLGPSATRTAKSVAGRLRHLESLVNDMLTFVRQGNLDLEEISIGGLLDGFADCLSGPDAESRLTEVRFEKSANEGFVLGNRQALQSVFQNLVTNAWQAGGPNVFLSLSARREGAEFVVSLVDDGPGIEQELQSRVVQPFVTTRPDGVGLGLAIARRMLEAHGGRLSLESQPGKGSTFSMVLPLAGVGSTRSSMAAKSSEGVDR